MGNLYSYFSSADDDAAALARELPGGPAVGGFDTVETKGIDPAVQIGTLEEILTGRSFTEVINDPRSAHEVGVGQEADEHGVVTLTDTVAAALATVERGQLPRVAVEWSKTEEFWGVADPEALADFLAELADLAVRAGERGHRLYCWWSL